jgi:hypothetical protein
MAATTDTRATTDATVLPKWRLWTGRVLSALPVLALLMSASMKLAHGAPAVEMFVSKFGYQASVLTTLGVLELLCTAIYVIPRTRVLGAILLTGYLGGAVATHVRVSDPFVAPLLLGVLLWAGLYLLDPRVPALIPLRSSAKA